jgi:hypothetical protein
MKNYLLICFLFLFFSVTSLAQNTFQAKFWSDYNFGDHMSNVLSDGSVVFCYDLIDGGDVDMGLVRLDASGTILWSKRYSGTNGGTGYFPMETSDHKIMLAGHGPGNTILLSKIDLSGNLIWSVSSQFGTMRFNLPVETHDHGFAVVGSNQNGPSTYDTYLLRTDANGNFLWAKSYGANNTGPSKFVIETSDHGYLVAGSINTSGSEDLLIIKTDSLGNAQWTKQYGYSQADQSYSGAQTNDGGYLISYNAFNGANGGLHLLKVDSLGNTIWVKRYSNVYNGKFSCITNQNEIVVDGSANNILNGISATVLLKTDSEGNIIWNRFYSHYNTAATLNIAPDHGFVLLAPTFGFDTLIVTKTDSNGYSGCEESIGVVDVIIPPFTEDTAFINVSSGGSTSPYNLTVSNVQIYSELCNPLSVEETGKDDSFEIFPNPSSSYLQLKTEKNMKGRFSILTVLGQQVINEMIPESSVIDVSMLRDGIYFLRLLNQNKVKPKLFVVNHSL